MKYSEIQISDADPNLQELSSAIVTCLSLGEMGAAKKLAEALIELVECHDPYEDQKQVTLTIHQIALLSAVVRDFT